MFCVKTDEFGNVLQLDSEGVITLFLKLKNDKRNIGRIAGGTWYVTRRQSPDKDAKTKGKGHWHFLWSCWFISWPMIQFNKTFGWEWLDFEGYDEENKYYHFRVHVSELRSRKYDHVRYLGFEKQVELRPPEESKLLPFPGVKSNGGSHNG